MRPCARALAVASVLTLAACAPASEAGPPARPAPSTGRGAPSVKALQTWDAAAGRRDAPAVAKVGPRRAWRVPVRTGDDGGYVVHDGRVMVAQRTDPGSVSVTRIDPTTGTRIWKANTQGRGTITVDTD